MLAFITNISPLEIVFILVFAVLIFGRRLPEVAARGAVHLQRLRRGLLEFRRESGFDEELRKARRMIESPLREVSREVRSEPATWRPPSPRLEPHPDATVDAEVAQPLEVEEPVRLGPGATEAPGESPAADADEAPGADGDDPARPA